MQLTRFDRWLREKLAYETHVQTLRLPEVLPRGIRVINLPEAPGQRYKHLMIARRAQDADALISILRENSQMYATQIVDRHGPLVSFFAPKDKSFTWRVITTVVIAISVFFSAQYLKSLAENQEFRENLMEAIEILKG